MTLHLRHWPVPASKEARAGAEVMLIHGFTQNGDCWGPVADSLARHHLVSAVDAPGHGRSGHDEADLWRTADLLAEVVSGHSGEGARPPVVVGYSMGGRMALHLALAHPDRVSGLVLIGATPGIEDDRERAERKRADAALARRIRSEPLDSFLDEWLANPLFAGLHREAACRSARLSNRPEGLAASLVACGTGSQEPLWGRLGEITVPVLLMVGSDDHKFGAIARRMTAGLVATSVETAVVAGTHAVHLERPDVAARAILDWMATRLD